MTIEEIVVGCDRNEDFRKELEEIGTRPADYLENVTWQGVILSRTELQMFLVRKIEQAILEAMGEMESVDSLASRTDSVVDDVTVIVARNQLRQEILTKLGIKDGM